MEKKIKSRGIPSKEAFWLPPYYSEDIRRFEDDSGNATRNVWKLEEITKFIFPPKYQEKYYEIASSFLSFISERGGKVSGSDVGPFLRESGISKATFYNRVLPRLKRVGIVRVKRETQEGKNKKYMHMDIELSKTFGNYLLKIADSWLAHIDDVRSLRRQ
ncbi:MAG: hypothetical protein D6769_01950 [Methanobacteriota archaeon]|nr:MAG: hypothetical protein D6769_01950 [Euryarchaeota archaeon]